MSEVISTPSPAAAAVAAPAPCACGHGPEEHDAIASRYCRATVSSALYRGCICRVAPSTGADGARPANDGDADAVANRGNPT